MKDPGSFNINITLGNKKVVKAMLDLGASINLMPFSIYTQLGLGDLKKTTMSIQLADRSVKFPQGIIEDLLVQVDKLIVPVDFVVMEMETCNHKLVDPVILLGRPFMATTQTIIDVHNGKLKMTVLGETVEFDVFKAMSLPPCSFNDHCLYVDECEDFSAICELEEELDDLGLLIPADSEMDDDEEAESSGKMMVQQEENMGADD